MSNVVEAKLTSPELVLLQMMLENDQLQSDADKARRESAREAQVEAMDDELEAIDEQAAAIRTGAAIEGGLQIAGGSLTVAATLSAPAPATNQTSGETKIIDEVSGEAGEPSLWAVPTLQVGGQLATGLAKPAGELFGRAPETAAQHDAKAAAQAQEQASWVAQDAENHRQQTEEHARTAMQQVQGILRTQRETTAALLANV